MGAKSKKPKSKKRVRFHCTAKDWDGPREVHILLKKLAIEFWQDQPKVSVLNSLVEKCNGTMLVSLREVLRAAIDRIKESDAMGAELIPGGGKQGIRLKIVNIPHAKLLIQYIGEAHDLVLQQLDMMNGLNLERW